MFQGTAPLPIRKIIHETARGWPAGADVWVACSGNFTIERTLASMGFRLHSNDVSIYSCALGRWKTGEPVGVRLRPEYATDGSGAGGGLSWLAAGLDDEAGSVATIMLSTNFLPYLGRREAYFTRQLAAYRDQWPRLLDETRATLERAEFAIESYTAGDCRDFVDAAPVGDPVLGFPPFFTGGYEKLYEHLEEVFEWDKPAYREFAPQDASAFLDQMAAHDHWWIGAHDPLPPPYDAHLRAVVPFATGSTAYCYSDRAPARIVALPRPVEPVTIPRLSAGDTITADSRLTVRKLRAAQFDALRLVYLDPKITHGKSAGDPYAVLVDGKLIGAFSFGAWMGANMRSLMSDFAVDRSDYPRLSKLVLLAAMSREAVHDTEVSYTSRLRTLTTTVYARNPVSMKYRGLWEKHSSEELPKGSKHRFKLVYRCEPGKWTLAEALQTWLDKWGERR